MTSASQRRNSAEQEIDPFSMATLRTWGVAVIEPVDTGRGSRMAPVQAILDEGRQRLSYQLC